MSKITIAMLSILTAVLFASGVIAQEATASIEAQQKSVTGVQGLPAIKAVSPSTSGAAQANIKAAPSAIQGTFTGPVTISASGEAKVITVVTTTNKVIPVYKQAPKVSGVSGSRSLQAPAVTSAEVYLKPTGTVNVIQIGKTQFKLPKFIRFIGKPAAQIQVIDAEGSKISEATIVEGTEKIIAGLKIKPTKIVSATNNAESNIEISITAE